MRAPASAEGGSPGNRLVGESYGTSAVGTYDEQDRLLSYGAHTYTYAPNGELESRSGPSPLSTEYNPLEWGPNPSPSTPRGGP